ncbi:hypothetical protein BKA70DRAFT_1571430 [Coprinopsis sp. MPI-PUGE-AT-0042]|nr:hypothetical protein BKA70DRAFT_1571430 [Coprinopsis sp. MPI-PUGE-AT-0042]
MFDAVWKAICPSRSSDPSKEGMKISSPPLPLPSEIFDSADWYCYEGKRVRRAPRGIIDADRPNGNSVHFQSCTSILKLAIPSWSPSSHLYAIDEEDYDVGSHLNLGTETPLSGSISLYPFPPSRGSVTAEHRSHNEGGSNMSMPSSKLGPSVRRNSLTSTKSEADRDCGICPENAIKPCRARCCGKMFCSDHLNDWLGTSEHSPNCNAPLTLGGDNAIMLSSPRNSERSSETPKRATPRRGSMTPSASQSAPRITTTSSSRGGALFHRVQVTHVTTFGVLPTSTNENPRELLRHVQVHALASLGLVAGRLCQATTNIAEPNADLAKFFSYSYAMRCFLAEDLDRLLVEGINAQVAQGMNRLEPVPPFGDSFERVQTYQCSRRTWGMQPEEDPIPPSHVKNAAAAGFTAATTLATHLHLSSQTVTPKHSNEWPKRQDDVRGIPIPFLNHHALLAKRVPLPPRRPRNGQLTLHCRAHSSLTLPPHRRGDAVARRGAFHDSPPTHLDQR